jgi:hypothetical protein
MVSAAHIDVTPPILENTHKVRVLTRRASRLLAISALL